MNIAVNTRLLINDKLDGIGIFARESLKRIVQAHPEHRFFFLFNREIDPQYLFADNVEPLLVPPLSRDPLTLLFWFEYVVPKTLRRIGANVFFSPEPSLSLRTSVPSIAVIHDLNYEHHRNVLPPHWNWYYRTFTSHFARKATRIGTVSIFSRDDIVRTYGIAPEKIDVVYNGSPEHTTLLTPEEAMAVRRELTGGAPYFYFVGTQQPRKNIAALFRAFDQFKAQDTQNTKLIMVGRKKWWDAEITEAWERMQHKEEVIFAGRMEDNELARLAGGAIALVYVPFFEGFGIPILEAFCAGTPVITANITSMPEVAADAAILVDPHSVEAIAGAMRQIATDETLRSTLIARGLQRQASFSWDATAHLLWESIERASGAFG